MPLPYTFQSNFETGTSTDQWDSETDGATPAQVDIVHYTELARSGMRPHSGAYCMRIQMATTTAGDGILIEGDLDISADAQAQVQFWLYFSDDFTATSQDDVHLFELLATSTIEICFGFRISATGVINLGIGETTPATLSSVDLEKGVWHLIELDLNLDNADTSGTINLYVTREGAVTTSSAVHAAQVGTLTQSAVTTGSLGVQEALNTTSGTILIDDFKYDTAATIARTRQDLHPWSSTVRLTQSGHAFVGPGRIDNITLVASAGQNAVQELRLWDTDRARTGIFGSPIVELHTTGTGEIVDPAGMPVYVTRGAYVEIVDTDDSTNDASALVQVGWASGWGDESAIIRHGLRTS